MCKKPKDFEKIDVNKKKGKRRRHGSLTKEWKKLNGKANNASKDDVVSRKEFLEIDGMWYVHCTKCSELY